MRKNRIIINTDIDPSIAIKRVGDVMALGKISAGGKSYCYGTSFPDCHVFTDKPRVRKKGVFNYGFTSKSSVEVEDNGTYIFYVQPNMNKEEL